MQNRKKAAKVADSQNKSAKSISSKKSIKPYFEVVKPLPIRNGKVAKTANHQPAETHCLRASRSIVQSVKDILFDGESLTSFIDDALLTSIAWRRRNKQDARALFEKRKKKKAS